MRKNSIPPPIVANYISEKYYNPKTVIESSELTRFEKIPTSIYPEAEDGARNIAEAIEALIRQARQRGSKCVLGLGTGKSLNCVYRELVRRHTDCGLSFSNVVVFNAYEYFPLTKESKLSSINQLRENLLNYVDIPEENIYSPSAWVEQHRVPDVCREYEQLIARQGGLDLLLLGIGRMGNIASNEPGSALTSTTRLILIDNVSRSEMTLSFGSHEAVPPCSITMGIATILQARAVYLTAWGDSKADIIRQAVEGNMSDAIPATFLQTHNNAHVVTDLAASAKLTRMIHPWLVTSCTWTDKLTRAALVWLCGVTHKPILKLTNKDYNENGLSELLALYGSAYNANIKIFNDLQHTITGWPGGKPNADDTYRPERATPYPKRVVVFSPHPDDDVISMGGTIRRLVEQGHDVHIAYQTSGNIAVGDEEAMRYMHFINGFDQLFGKAADSNIADKYGEIKNFVAHKHDGDTDSPDLLTIKKLIRRGEARTACAYNHIASDHVHFLDLPFYESGRIEKLPMGIKDIEIVRQLIQQIEPHQIYVAGDFADPHGTHIKCTHAVMEAIVLEQEAQVAWLRDCRVWMYRGAWAEWDIENIEMCVPMSPEELRAKRNAILKHQSQMESAPFLGNDERLFWQRAEDRNRGTAELYDHLGLACYEAMEAFVEWKFDDDEKTE